MTINRVLNARNVAYVFRRCLSKGPDVRESDITIKDVATTPSVRFDPARLDAYSHEISKMLAQLPATFQSPSGDSLSEAVVDVDNHPWTDTRTDGLELVAKLFQLGLAADLVTCVLPRTNRPSLYEGEPYFQVDLRGGAA